MSLTELFARRRKEIHERWLERIIGQYPAQSAGFIRSEKDRFRNPIGATIRAGTAAVLDALEAGGDRERLRAAVDGLIRLRAVQDTPPSGAVSFVFLLKEEIRKALSGEIRAAGLEADRERMDAKLDALALDAFDLYMACREKVFEVRVAELRNRTFKLLEREGEVTLKRGADR